MDSCEAQIPGMPSSIGKTGNRKNWDCWPAALFIITATNICEDFWFQNTEMPPQCSGNTEDAGNKDQNRLGGTATLNMDTCLVGLSVLVFNEPDVLRWQFFPGSFSHCNAQLRKWLQNSLDVTRKETKCIEAPRMATCLRRTSSH